MVELQKPACVYMGGGLRPWDEATLHISCEAVTRGLSVFEGLKGYWAHDNGSFGILALPRHFERLRRSAKLLHIPFTLDYAGFERACHELVRALYEPDRDLWLRATLYVVEGHWGEGTIADLVVTAYHEDKARPGPIDIGVSTWQRAGDTSLPPRIKSSANYQVARMARIEGRERGCSEMVLLNQWGRVTEATGACLLMVRSGTVVTPPATEGRLESITAEIVAQLCRDLGIGFEERPIDRTELYVADELTLVGTLAELVPVRAIDGIGLPADRPVMDRVSERFWSAVRRRAPHPAIDFSIVEPETAPAPILEPVA